MYNNYMPNFPINQQGFNDDYIKTIEKEEELLKKKKENYLNRYQQQPAINQTIQLAPNGNNGIKYVNSIEDVKREFTIVDTAFITNDYKQMYIKNAKGEIRPFEIKEIIPKDEKDILIEKLMSENEKLKGMINDESTSERSSDTTIDEPIKTKSTSNVSVSRTSKAKSK